jgi:hypothetical protein
MTSLAVTTQGTKLYVSPTGSPPVYAQIPDVTNIPSFGSSERPQIDTSNMDSTSREFRFGLADTGSVEFEINFVPDNTVHATIEAAAEANTQKQLKVELSDGTTYEGNGYFVSFAKSAEIDNVYKASCSFKWSAAPTKNT